MTCIQTSCLSLCPRSVCLSVRPAGCLSVTLDGRMAASRKEVAASDVLFSQASCKDTDGRCTKQASCKRDNRRLFALKEFQRLREWPIRFKAWIWPFDQLHMVEAVETTEKSHKWLLSKDLFAAAVA